MFGNSENHHDFSSNEELIFKNVCTIYIYIYIYICVYVCKLFKHAPNLFEV